MTANSNEKHIKIWTPATCHIEVEGHLAKSWSDRLAGMRITTRNRADQTPVTILIGRLRDQAELSGVLNSLYDLHMPILKVDVAIDEQPFYKLDRLHSGAKPFTAMYQFHVPQLTLAIVLLTQGTANSREHAENLLMQLYDFVVSTHNTFFQIDVGKRREAVEKAMKIGIL